MKELAPKRIMIFVVIFVAIVFLFGTAQFVWMKIYEKENISFFNNLDPKLIEHIVINEIVNDKDNNKHYLVLKKISNPDDVKKFGRILHNINKFKPGEKPLFLRMFLIEVVFSNGSNKELLVWIQKVPNDILFIRFIKRFDYLNGLVKGYKALGFAESKELKGWLGTQINLKGNNP